MEGTAGGNEPTDPAQQRRAMLAAMEEAVLEEDYTFANEIGANQEHLSSTDLIEYMDVKRRGTEDPVEERRWQDAIHNFWTTLEGQTFTEEDVERLNTVKNRLEFDSIVDNDAEADETIFDDAEASPGWEEDKFYVDLPAEEVARIRSSPFFGEVERQASGNRGMYEDAPPNLSAAAQIVERASGNARLNMKLVLDWFVFEVAERVATGDRGVYENVAPDLETAVLTISAYASDANDPGEVTERMRKALDKHVMAQATRVATGDRGVYENVAPNLDAAKDIVEKYASSPGRARAMLHELGFM